MNLIDRYFLPDEFHGDIYQIDVQALSGAGIKAVLLDIDNTLVTYDDPKPTEKVLRWFEKLENAGIKIAFISNNHRERVKLFNSELNYFATWDSKKPSGKQYRAALDSFGLVPSQCAVIGDQVFTDVWSGKRIGSYTVLVNPIKDKKTLFFRFKRMLEVPVLKRYRKKHNVN